MMSGMIPFILFRASLSLTAGQAFRKTPLQVRSVPPPVFQDGWSGYMYVSLSLFVSFVHL
jgi:hypothetical protein